MRGFWGFTKRNMLIFFKDRQSVIFSLLTSIIVLVLNILFLRGNFVDGVNGVLGQYPELDSLVTEADVSMFANLILLTGIMGSAMIMVPYNCLTTLVKDRENKVDYDILATPIRRGQVIFSYFLAAAVSSVLMTSAILAVGLLVLGTQGKTYLSAGDILEIFGIVALGSVSATAFMMVIMLFFKSSGASGAFFGMLSAASGFVIGAYIPISQFSGGVQTICNLFPASQVTILLRNKLLLGILDHMDGSIGGLDQGAFVVAVKEIFSFRAHLFEKDLGIPQMLVYVAACMALCLVLQIVIYGKTYKKK